MESNFFRLNTKDFLKGLLMAILVPSLVIILEALKTNELNFDWKVIATTAIGGGLAYLLKNLLSGGVQTDLKN